MRVGIDSNLLLLLVIGRADQTLILRHKRLPAYTPQDFHGLIDILKTATAVCATPYVLTEVSNLMLFGLQDFDSRRVRLAFRVTVERLQELTLPTRDVLEQPEYRFLDLADCAWLQALDRRSLLLTDDAKLAASARARRIPVVTVRDFGRG
jgi:rRNA-processing protein FCF1